MKESGLTLIELMVTMAIMGVLASVAVPLSNVSGKRTRELELREHLRTVRAAIDTFKSDWNRDGDTLLGAQCLKNKLTCKEVSGVSGYPKSLTVLLGVKLTGGEAAVAENATRRYLRKIPVDPMTVKEWKLRCYIDPADASTWCGEDVYDLASFSTDVGLDGKTYREW